MATKLSKKILCDMFPTLDKTVLLEVFVAHEKSLERTVEAVRASMGDTQEAGVQTVLAPEARVAYRHSLMEQAKEEQRKVDQEHVVCVVGISVLSVFIAYCIWTVMKNCLILYVAG